MSFTEYTNARYRASKHHHRIAEELEAVERGENDRLMLLTAPRMGKSELASRRFPAFSLGRRIERQFISVSATSPFAADFGREVRDLVGSREYHSLFPDVTLVEDSKAQNKWLTSTGGSYYAVGIGGQILGKGADILLIDDPFSTMEAAQSQAERKRVWDWFQGSAYNRLQPGGAIVVINHRMHEDDLSGRLLAQQHAGGDTWRVVELPAIADSPLDPLGRQIGEALWPEWYPIEALERIRRNTLARYWNALYQQKPTAEEGDYFKSDWLRPYVEAPPLATMRVYGASDYAVKGAGGDYTVHVVVGVDPIGRMYLLDMWRGQKTSDVWIEAFCDLVLMWKPLEWAEEMGQIRSALGPQLRARQIAREAFVYRRGFPSTHDKAVRAQSMRGRMAIHGLYVPVGAPWYPDFEREMLNFPTGKHDDICLAEGTLVSMADGSQLPIEDVSRGDLVVTHEGVGTVEDAWVTSHAAAVNRVDFSDGSFLVMTGNHLVFVYGKGFVRCDELCMMDQVDSIKEVQECAEEHRPQRSSSTVDTGIDATPVQKISRTSDTLALRHPARVSCIDTFGKMSADLFLRTMKFIMSTRTGTTTTSVTSSASPPKSTDVVTRCRGIASRSSWFTWRQCARKPQSGTRATRVVSGMSSMAVRHGLGVLASIGCASAAVSRSLPLCRTLNFVAELVGNGSENLGLMRTEPRYGSGASLKCPRPSRASAAIGSSSPDFPMRRNTAPRPVVCVTGFTALSERARVRNLTVRGAHTFYANGILTHNCDATGLIGQLLDHIVPGDAPEVRAPARALEEATLDEMWEIAESRGGRGVGRI